MDTSARRMLTIALPAVEPAVAEFMRSFKQAHSPDSRVAVPPHFTLLFGCAAVPMDDYVAHVSKVAARTKPVQFVCRYAMLGTDDEDDRAYVFLVPDEGYAAISRLHDALYAGPLAPHLRLDLPYVPHITIGVTGDRARAKALCDQFNEDGVLVAGTLRELTVGHVREGQFEGLSTHELDA